MPGFPWYVYLQDNGDLVIKNPAKTPKPFDILRMPHVVHYWYVDSETMWDSVLRDVEEYRKKKWEEPDG